MMDGFSLLVGGMLGLMVGWAFSSASAKRREANYKLNQASKAWEEMALKEQEILNNRERSLTNKVQSFLLNLLGLIVIVVLGIILFSSLG